MPKRVVDGEGVWGSDKLLALKDEYRAEYANLVPLAEANGVFEADPHKVWSRVYSYNRRDKDVEWVRGLLEDLVRVGMLLLWEEKGKVWGFWEGNQKAGRLPSPSEQEKYKNLPPKPPKSLLSDTSETSISLLARLGPVRSGQSRSEEEPAAQIETHSFNENNGQETEMKPDKQIEILTEQFFGKRANLRGWNADELKKLTTIHKGSAVVRAFGEWAAANSDNPDISDPVHSFLRESDELLSGGSPTQAAAKDPQTVNLARELAYLSDGQLAFTDKQRVRLSEVLQEFNAEEIISAFKAWFADQDLTDPKTLKWGANEFVQKVDGIAYAARRKNQERVQAEKQREIVAHRLQEQAEAERREREKANAAEAESFDPLADL